PAQRLHALGGGREGHAARGRLRHQLRLPNPGGLDRLSEPRHPRLVGGLGVSRKGDPLLELGERPVGLLGLQRDLPRLHLDRLAMPVDPVVLPRRLLEVLLAGEPLRLSRMEGPLDLSDLPADRRHLGLEPRHSFLSLVQFRRDTVHAPRRASFGAGWGPLGGRRCASGRNVAAPSECAPRYSTAARACSNRSTTTHWRRSPRTASIARSMPSGTSRRSATVPTTPVSASACSWSNTARTPAP